MREVDNYGGVVKAIEQGYIQRRIAERARQRKELLDAGERVVVGVNRYQHQNGDSEGAVRELFKMDPKTAHNIVAKFNAIRAGRDNGAVAHNLARLSDAAAKDRENLMPYIVDCCHSYATVGEMVATMKNHWGEFREPTGL
jgi:methylmalonyl-CoA mutase N-terminal domain/subunit